MCRPTILMHMRPVGMLLNSLIPLIRRKRSAATGDLLASIAPDAPFFAVGDLHGCPHLLEALLEQLDAYDADCPLVMLGDYIDRGEQSAQLLDLLIDLESNGSRSVLCLRGNHEQMLLDFLDARDSTGAGWLSDGGLQTLVSFGIDPGKLVFRRGGLDELRQTLSRRLGNTREDWLRRLPVCWQSGNVFVSHAGLDPAHAVDEQDEQALLWGHRSRPARAVEEAPWSVQGHTIVEKAHVYGKSILVDTGAYATSRLSAVHVSCGQVEFFQTLAPSRG